MQDQAAGILYYDDEFSLDAPVTKRLRVLHGLTRKKIEAEATKFGYMGISQVGGGDELDGNSRGLRMDIG